MAALATPHLHVVELRHLRAGQLDTLLDEESGVWKRDFDWDFRPSAELVRRFLGMQALSGHALMESGTVIGYVYFVAEDRKGLIGDLFVRERWREPEHIDALLDATVAALAATPGLRRIESQLMTVAPHGDVALPLAGRAREFSRDFYVRQRNGSAALREVSLGHTFECWQPKWADEASQLIAAAYRGHIDSDINDQYRTVGGARRFLHNIVQYPGCGTFFQPASYVALDSRKRLAGLCLASLVAHDVGHLTQICVGPQSQGRGLGYELMRRSIATLENSGCRSVSLTVTSSNQQAISVYERAGFRKLRQFRAITWDL